MKVAAPQTETEFKKLLFWEKNGELKEQTKVLGI